MKIEPNQTGTFSLCDEIENMTLVKIEFKNIMYFVEI